MDVDNPVVTLCVRGMEQEGAGTARAGAGALRAGVGVERRRLRAVRLDDGYGATVRGAVARGLERTGQP